MSAIDIDGGVAATTLAGDLTSGSTTIVLEDGSTYPPGGVNFYIVINRGQSHEEVVEISSRSGDALIVAGGVSGRGADNTSATAHSRGDTVEHCVPALALQDMNTHVSQTTGTPHGSAYLTPSDTAAAATALETARLIGGVSFDGTADIDLPGVNVAGTQDTSGNAATATSATSATSATTADALSTGRTIELTGDATGTSAAFDGSANVSIAVTTPNAADMSGSDNAGRGLSVTATQPSSPVNGDIWLDVS